MPTPITHDNLGRGMDQFHPESRIPDGYWQDSLNGDPTPEGTMRTRRGYQRYAGSIPIRVASVARSGTNLDFTLDGSFDLSLLRSTPIVVYGRLSATQTGDLSTTAGYKYYSSFTISSGKIRVTDSASGTYSDAAPQLVVYGIDWSTAIRAADAEARWGWVNGLDVYRTTLETRIMAGLGGNMFGAYSYDEASSTLGMPQVFPAIRGTVSGAKVIGPAFVSAAGSRTRGDISTTGVSGGSVQCTGATYDSGSGYVDFELSLPSMAVNGTLSTIITADVDWLTVDELSTALNGTWLIKAVTQGTNALTIRCAVDDITDDSCDVSGADGDAGIYTDRLTLSATSKFAEDDVIQSTGISATLDQVQVVGSSGSDVYLGQLRNTTYSIADAEVLYGTRTSAVLVPRNSGGTATVTNLVRGDMLEVAGLTRRVRIVNVNPSADRTVSIAASAGTGTVTVTSGDGTSNLAVGDTVRLRSAGVYNGDVTITAIASSTEFEFETDETTSVTGATLMGLTVGLDEELELADDSSNTTYIQPHARWKCIEWSASNSTTSRTRVQHLDQRDYDDQLFLRTATLQDTMFVTDGENDMLKFDGSTLTRAGLFRWAPTILAMAGDDATGIQHPKYASFKDGTGDVTAQKVEVKSGSEKQFTAGEPITLTSDLGSSAEEFVTSVTSVDTADFIYFSDTAPSSTQAGNSGTVRRAVTLKYYARLNVLDANNNVVAGAACSSNDLTVRFGARSRVHLMVLRPPLLGMMDTARISVEIYRTGDYDGAPPFFLVYSKVLSYADYGGQLHVIDNVQPDLLVDLVGTAVGQLDPVHSALMGDELGTAWDAPPRAKALTTSGRRLIAANIRSYPELNVVLRRGLSAQTALTGAQANGAKFILRKSSNADTATDNDDTFVYEVVGQSKETTLANTRAVGWGTDGESFTVDLGSATGASASSATAGSWIYLTSVHMRTYDVSNSETKGSPFRGWWQVRSVAGGVLTIKMAGAKTRKTVSSFTDTGDLVNFGSAHGITTGTAVYLVGGTLPSGLNFAVTYYARVSTSTAITLHSTYAGALANSGQVTFTTGASGTTYLHEGDVRTNPASLFLATSQADVPVFIEDNYNDGYHDWNFQVIGGYVSSPRNSSCELVLARRLAAAINSTMVKVDPGLYASFRPWIVAGGGNDFGASQVVLTSPTAGFSPTFSFSSTTIDVYVNGVQLSSAAEAASRTRLFPSRLCRSYPNYPEVFDAPYAASDDDSDSAIDVNPNDGDEVVAVANLFGESNFTQSTNETVVIAAKRSAIYAVNTETKQFQPLRTGGRGCTYPRSLQTTPEGVTFANDEGLWLIDHKFNVVPIGKYMSRKWREAVQHDADEELICGVYTDSKWHLSVPVDSDSECDQVYVVDTTEAEDGAPRAAWTRYDAFPATGWVRSARDVLFGTTAGVVHTRRRANDASDYRDDAAAITTDWLYKPMNFGTSGLRKLLHAVEIGFRVVVATAEVAVSFATDVVASFRSADTFELADATDLTPTDVDTGIDDHERAIVRSLRFTPPRRRGNHQQVRIQCSTIDTPTEVTQFDFLVDPLTEGGLEHASQTRTRS